jgi:hypothetical protein
METDMLRMIRKGAAQHYPIKSATWGFSKPAPYAVPVLSLAVETEKQVSIFPEDRKWPRKQSWQIDIWTRGLHDDMLISGSQFSINDWFDEFTGIIYTAFHDEELEGTQPNTIKIVSREGDFLMLSIEGFIRYATASMPPTRITVDARFTKKTPHDEIGGKFHRETLPPHDPPYAAKYLAPNTAA